MGRLSPQRVASAEAQNAFDELEETTPLLDSEEFLDIPSIIGVEPVRVEPRIVFQGKQRRGQAAAQQSMPQVRDTEGAQFVMPYRNQMEVARSPGEAVPEFASRRQCGRPCGQDLEPRKSVCADLQQAARIGQLVDLIQDQP